MTDKNLGGVTGFDGDVSTKKKKSLFKVRVKEKEGIGKYEEEKPNFFIKNLQNIWVSFLFIVFFIMLIIFFTGDFEGSVLKEILIWIAWIVTPPLVAIIIKKILMI